MRKMGCSLLLAPVLAPRNIADHYFYHKTVSEVGSKNCIKMGVFFTHKIELRERQGDPSQGFP